MYHKSSHDYLSVSTRVVKFNLWWMWALNGSAAIFGLSVGVRSPPYLALVTIYFEAYRLPPSLKHLCFELATPM